jgi:hypothetical protein
MLNLHNVSTNMWRNSWLWKMQDNEEMEVMWPKESVPTKTLRHVIDSYKLLEFLEHYKLRPKT